MTSANTAHVRSSASSSTDPSSRRRHTTTTCHHGTINNNNKNNNNSTNNLTINPALVISILPHGDVQDKAGSYMIRRTMARSRSSPGWSKRPLQWTLLILLSIITITGCFLCVAHFETLPNQQQHHQMEIKNQPIPTSTLKDSAQLPDSTTKTSTASVISSVQIKNTPPPPVDTTSITETTSHKTLLNPAIASVETQTTPAEITSSAIPTGAVDTPGAVNHNEPSPSSTESLNLYLLYGGIESEDTVEFRDQIEATKKRMRILDDEGFDIVQFQFLDWLNGESKDGYSGNIIDEATSSEVFGGSLENLTSPFDPYDAWDKLLTFAKAASQTPVYGSLKLSTFARYIRVQYSLHLLLHDRNDLLLLLQAKQTAISSRSPALSSSEQEPTIEESIAEYLSYFTNSLFNPLFTKTTIGPIKPPNIDTMPNDKMTVYDLQQSFKGRGIVLSVSNKYFELAIHAIINLRMLTCKLPIEVFYAGPRDLSKDRIEMFEMFDNVKVVNLWDHIGEYGRQATKYAIKPYAMLASSFKEMIFIDADVIFLQNPDLAIDESKVFKQYGMMFFTDRNMGFSEAEFVNEFIPFPSLVAQDTRFMKNLSMHDLESGVVVLDKGRSGIIHGLLAACHLNNEENVIAFQRRLIYGDKETFWLGMEMVRVPWSYSPPTGTYAGTIGYKHSNGKICGHLFHLDEKYQPFWWNGGVTTNKADTGENRTYPTIQYWTSDVIGIEKHWGFLDAGNTGCLPYANDSDNVVSGELSVFEKGLVGELVEIFKLIADGGWRTFFTFEKGKKWLKMVY
ncbi:hypothetical protein HDU76_000233 [Blyttiomyces sp. JEL0837]|nr:hypothetical protein HDU76_000233 [Blyttiomyces sp. JEL0837]